MKHFQLQINSKSFGTYFHRVSNKMTSNCKSEMLLYANCCSLKKGDLNQFDCQKEFQMLKQCIK